MTRLINLVEIVGGLVILLGGIAVFADWRGWQSAFPVPRKESGRHMKADEIDPRDPWVIFVRRTTALVICGIGVTWLVLGAVRGV